MAATRSAAMRTAATRADTLVVGIPVKLYIADAATVVGSANHCSAIKAIGRLSGALSCLGRVA